MNFLLTQGKSLLDRLFNTRAAGLYMLLFAIAIGVATFIENDFGTSAAQKVIYRARWFEVLLGLFGGSLIYNIFTFRMVQQKKWALLMFHAAIVIILIGAGVTRYWGFEGMMHIREQATSNQFLSAEPYLGIEARMGQRQFEIHEPVYFASLGDNSWEELYLFGNEEVRVEVEEFIPNSIQKIIADEEGLPMLKMVIAGANGREEYILTEGETRRIRGQLYQFGDRPVGGAINLRFEKGNMQVQLPRTFRRMVMATQKRDTLFASDAYRPLIFRALHDDGRLKVVFSEFHPKGRLSLTSESPKVKNESLQALRIKVSAQGQSQETVAYGKRGLPGKPAVVEFDNLSLAISYGSKEKVLPFALKLEDFQLEKYPGTDNAASYASEVQLLDQRTGLQENHRIYMNHILNYEGYRFFQSSYDRDEKGTYLSVNHDFWGTLISYIGYGLLTLGLMWTFFAKNTRFAFIQRRLQTIRSSHVLLPLLLILGAGALQARSPSQPPPIVEKTHAEKVSRLVVQDFKGRMKPVHTLSREVLRKVYRKENFEGNTADQVMLSMFADSRSWYGVPLIKMGRHPKLKELLGVEGKYASYRDFFASDGSYKLKEEIRRVHGLAPIDRGTFEKEILKVDERLNIVSMIFSGHLLKVVPVPNDPGQTWQAKHSHGNHDHAASVSDRFFEAYEVGLRQAMESGDYSYVNLLIEELKVYQKENGGAIVPSNAKIGAEISLNNSRVFNRLTGLYMLLGLGFLTCMFISVFNPNARLKMPYRILLGLLIGGFAMHTLGLGIRWYVSGRAPWSNGYESMIYIAWTATLAGVIFSRKSLGGLAATMVLAGTILFVATLSFLDPEITPLVPVLRSYWLTIHVSLEAGSYGFLMLGALMGLINLSLIALLSEKNRDRVKRMVEEMSYLSEMTLTAGLAMISIGTYLGGVWANESWGRYWGWDAKETWALVSILIYAFILHMRLIPKLFGLFSYNLSTLFGLASIIMTYYGVNYYLSGLHSYATGDPVPVPSWVYIAVGVVAVISLLAYRKKGMLKSVGKGA